MNAGILNSPFFRLLLPFAIGILVQHNIGLKGIVFYFFALSLVLFLLSLSSNIGKSFNFRWVFGLFVFVFCFAAGAKLTERSQYLTEWSDSSIEQTYRLRLLDNPLEKPRSLQAKVAWREKKFVLYFPKDSLSQSLLLGDEIVVRTIFRKPQNQPSVNSFDYASYLQRQGYAGVSYVSAKKWEKVASSKSSFYWSIRVAANRSRLFLLDRLQEIIEGEKSFAVAGAMLLGYKVNLDEDLRRSFSATGASHVLAVSGLHTGILYSICFYLLSFFGSGRLAQSFRQIILIILLWGFAFVTGLSPSVVRATTMLTFVALAFVLRERKQIVNTIAASAFIMLLYNPMYLFDVGFQLSYLAVFAIVRLNPYLSSLFVFRASLPRYIWSLLTVSTAAQLGTLPLSIYYFQQFPVIFLATNLFVLPMAFILLFLLLLSLLLWLIFPLPLWAMYPLNFSLEFFIRGLEFLERVPYSNVSLPSIDILSLLCFYLYIILLAQTLIKKRAIYFYLCVLLVLFQVIYYL